MRRRLPALKPSMCWRRQSLDANRRLIIDRTATLKLPAIYQWPETVKAGGLAAYGPRRTEVARQRARQLVKIFRGAKAGDIPVEQPDKFDLVINLRTAKAIGLEVPPIDCSIAPTRSSNEPLSTDLAILRTTPALLGCQRETNH